MQPTLRAACKGKFDSLDDEIKRSPTPRMISKGILILLLVRPVSGAGALFVTRKASVGSSYIVAQAIARGDDVDFDIFDDDALEDQLGE